ncbi:MAG: efflux RND transporter permease subunit [Methyloceanibacter sp.]|uniref:efflux RND transporter permease subunit n=1 Tax=Methyloceanibacter sp. TaxID=1965321 RepID=UPI003EDFD2BA
MTAGFGLEKLGLVSLRYPWICLAIAVLVTPILAFGASQLQFSSDIREIFRSGDPAFDQLDIVEERFPDVQRDIHVVVSSDKPFDLEDLKALKELDKELAALAGVRSVLSMFSAIQEPEEGAELQPLFPDDLDTIENWDALRGEATENPLVAEKLLSDDGSLAVFSVSLTEKNRSEETDRRLVGEVRTKAEEVLAGTDLNLALTGLAVMRIEIVSSLARDQKIFRYLALGVSLVIAWLFFRRLAFVAVAGIPAVAAVIWLLGGMWLAGQEINLLTGVAPTIVLVIVFSDCLHLLFSVRNGVRAGADLEAAIDRAVRRVGPACVLTSLTTTLALASLIWMPHPFVANFGIVAASGTAVALIGTLILVPPLALLFLRSFARENQQQVEKNSVLRGIDTVCHVAADAVTIAPRAITAVGVLLVLAGGFLHLLNEPRYSYASNLPQNHPALAGLNAVDSKLAGANALLVALVWPKDYHLMSFHTLDVIRKVHATLAREPALGAITSAHTIEEWLGGGVEGEDRLMEFLEGAQDTSLVKGLASLDENSVLVTAWFGELTSDELDPMMDRLERRLNRIAEEDRSKVEISVTGIVPVTARASHEMIELLNRSLMITVGMILVLIALAMRSVGAGLVSILPNLFPLAMGGAYLYLVGWGLQFTNLVAFTVGFGIAVDSTIHVLNRYRLEKSDEVDLDSALRQTITAVGPVVIISTIVLAAGIGTSLLSELPMVSLYGTIVVIVLLASMVGALLFLPALMETVEGWRRKSKFLSKALG